MSFENGSQHEIHGKLFESIIEPNTTYLDDIGIPDVPIEVIFDGTPVAMTSTTGNGTSVIDPFVDYGNGTFEFLLDFNKAAGEYELVLYFDGWPPTGGQIWKELTYKAVVYVNHPSIIDAEASPDTVTVGDALTISGSIADDTGWPITHVGLQVKLDNVLLGPSSDGVYLDDVRVTGASFFDDFEDDEGSVWTSYAAPGRGIGDQWERGVPTGSVGPIAPHSGASLFGTNLDGNYDRGAWSFLVTDDLDFTVDQEYKVSFYAWWSVYWVQDYCYLLVSDDGGQTWDEDNPLTFMGGSLIQVDWTYYEFDVSEYKGSDSVRFAFVFYSIDKTLDVRTDGSYSYIFLVPMSTTADRHRVSVIFTGFILFRAGQAHVDITVKRITHFEYGTNISRKIGYRNSPVQLLAYLKDNMDEVLSTNIRGAPYLYQALIYWDPTWAIDDGIGQKAGLPQTMEKDTGEVSVNFVVPWNQTLGPVNATFSFPGSDYYTAAQEADIYYVKAHTYILLPPTQDRNCYRNQDKEIRGDLRIVPEESIDPIEPGDPIGGEFVSAFWKFQPIGNRRTLHDGSFSYHYMVPSTHELGDVGVLFDYDGSSLFEPVTLLANYSVVSEVFITLEDQVVYKGSWAYINGTVEDDLGEGIAGVPIIIEWKRPPEIGRATSQADGTFSLQYYIEYEDKIGNISVIARFQGNEFYRANETAATYTIMINTILERRDRTFTVVRGQQIEIAAKLYEDWGGYRGVEAQREIVTLTIDGIVVGEKRTAFDGSVIFTVPIDSKLFEDGLVSVVLEFKGNDFYAGSWNITELFIGIFSIISFAEINVNGDPFDPVEDVIRRGDSFHGRVLVQDDNFQPLPGTPMTISFKPPGLRSSWQVIWTGFTDDRGYFDFNYILSKPTGGEISFKAETEGLPMDMVPILNITYVVPPVVTTTSIIDTIGNRDVIAGDELVLEVKVADPSRWDTENLTFSLVSPPDGVDISSNGTITWVPNDDQVGEHEITVWLYDKRESEASAIVITVSKDETGTSGGATSIPMALIVILVCIILGIILIAVFSNR
jgi:hypothetical protein